MRTKLKRLLFIAPFMTLVSIFLIFPALFGFFYSFTNYDPRSNISMRYVGFSNYAAVVSDEEFKVAARNMLVFVPLTVLFEMILGLIIAYLLRNPFRGRSIVRVALLIPWLISPVANGLMWRFLFNQRFGLLNFWLILFGLPRASDPRNPGFAFPTVMAIEIWRRVPLVSFLILPGILAIPPVYWAIAELEGLSHFARIRMIILPRLWRLLLTIMLLMIGDMLGTFEGTLLLFPGGPRLESVTIGFYSYWNAFKIFNLTFGMTSAWLIAAAVLFVGFWYLILIRDKTAKYR